MNYVNKRNETEIQIMREIATSGRDRPVLMLNLNYYSAEAAFPDGSLYRNYMAVLERFLPVVGAKVLWRHPILGQATGTQNLHEILAAWYPSHQAFLDLPDAPGAEENFRLRAIAVEHAVIHRVSGEVCPFMPGQIADDAYHHLTNHCAGRLALRFYAALRRIAIGKAL